MFITVSVTRAISRRPVFCLPSSDKYTIAVRCCPTLFKLRMRHPPEQGKPLWEQTHTLLKLPYR